MLIGEVQGDVVMNVDGPQDLIIKVPTQAGDFSFIFKTTVDLRDITERKASFRRAWESFQASPSDPKRALIAIHAAFQAGQLDSVHELMLNPLVISCAAELLDVPDAAGCSLLIAWADILWRAERLTESVQILDDAIASGKASTDTSDRLRQIHYYWAQYSGPPTGSKAAPEIRIEHLKRILELGFEEGYIHKFLAEAYHDLGDDSRARECLSEAYRLDPNLGGAVRISRALGFHAPSKSATAPTAPRRRYAFSRPGTVPLPSQIRKWEQSGDWDLIFAAADPNDYSPSIRSSTRNTFVEIATSLGRGADGRAKAALTGFLDSVYPNVRAAAVLSLSKIGDEGTLSLLSGLNAGDKFAQTNMEACVAYLDARLNNPPADGNSPPDEAFALARQILDKARCTRDRSLHGEARFLLEQARLGQAPWGTQWTDTTCILARTCAAMDDWREAVELVVPILPTLSERKQLKVGSELADWLWSLLVFQRYDPSDDDYYVLALDAHLEQINASANIDVVLDNLRQLTRWLELLGAAETTLWTRRLIRTEAPGTQYVDQRGRENYVRSVELSSRLKEFLATFDERIKVNAASKVRQVLGSQGKLHETPPGLPGNDRSSDVG